MTHATRLPQARIRGARGDWAADVDGERLAVLHDTWWTGRDTYRDPMTGADVNGKRYQDYVALLRSSDRVVVQRDKGKGSLERSGYVGVFSFADLVVHPDGAIELRLTARVGDGKK